MANQFSIEPAGTNVGAELAGLGEILAYNREKKAEQETAELKRKEQADAQTAMLDAWRSRDPAKMMEASIQYPFIAEQANQGMGLMQDFQKQEASEFATQVLANPEKAGEIAERRIQLLNMQGRDPTHTMDFYNTYLQDPEGALMELQMTLAASNPEAYKAYRDANEAGDFESKVVGDFLVDSRTGKVIFDGSTGDAPPEHGVTPIVFRNPQTGKYSAYLPAKDGSITEVQIPEGEEFVPDSGRMGYNPANILEKSAAETQAERIKQMPAQQRALLRRQQQATVVDDSIDRALQSASGWTTGFFGNVAARVPGTDAYDLARTLDTIRANIGFDKLQEMREQSPTGGALGPVSDFENRNLQAVLGNLEQSQSKEQFIYNLEQVRNAVRDIVHGSEMQFIDTYGNPSGTAPAQGAPQVTGQVLRFDAQGNLIP